MVSAKSLIAFVLATATLSWCLIEGSNIRRRDMSGLGSCSITTDMNIALKPFGAEGTIDFTFTAPSSFYVNNISEAESLEVNARLHLPRIAQIESLWLWIDTLQQPAMHIGRTQAENTYNQIARIERRDPAILTYVERNADTCIYQLNVFPIFKGGARKVRIWLRFPSDPWKMSEEIPLGKIKSGTSMTIKIDTSVNSVPVLVGGKLQFTNNFSDRTMCGTDFTGAPVFIRWGSSDEIVDKIGLSGCIVKTANDTSYFSLRLNVDKFINSRNFSLPSSYTFVWVPNAKYENFISEKLSLSQCIDSTKPTDRLNVLAVKQGSISQLSNSTRNNAKHDGQTFLQAVPFSGKAISEDEVFAALKQAFSSLYYYDTSAVVVIVDQSEPISTAGRNITEEARRGGELVMVNILKSRLIAFVHYKKRGFYETLSRMMNVSIFTDGQPQLGKIGKSGNFSIKNISFLGNVSDVIVKNDNSLYYQTFTDYIQENRLTVTLFGKTTDSYLLGEVTYESNISQNSKAFAITRIVPDDCGTNMQKLWIKEAASSMLMNTSDWSQYSIYNPSFLINPVQSTWSTSNYSLTILKNAATLSRQNGILTSATALIALEPGQNLIGDSLSIDGMYANEGPICVSTEKNMDITIDKSAMSVSPNPFNPETRINFSLAKETHIKLAVYDISGRLILNLMEGMLKTGNHHITLNGSKLPGGIYIVRLEGKGLYLTKKITLLK